MGSLKMIILFVGWSICFFQFGVEGDTCLSYEDDMELKTQLAILNKPPIKSFQTKSGTYDCIDIHKQPAFDHPLLKNHKIQMEPTFQPSLIKKSAKPAHEEMNCPQGTVPIRRTEKEDLIRAKYLSRSFSTSIHQQTAAYPGEHFVALKPSESKTYRGAHATISIHALDVKNDQYSAAQIWVGGGPEDHHTSLQAGWLVSPQLTNDNLTRLFTYWRVTNSNAGCFDLFCPGFVQVSSKAAPGSELFPMSEYGGRQYIINLSISQDEATGNWWVTLDDINLGYWPKSLLPELEEGASMVAWGGLAGELHPNEDSPPMGNGHYPENDDYTRACFMQSLKIVDSSYDFVKPDQNNMRVSADNLRCYGLRYYGYDTKIGVSFLFGGPGGKCGV